MNWKTIYTGPMARVLPLQAALEGNGFLTYIADQNMKTIDPFATGLNCLDVQLQVPEIDLGPVAAALQELESGEGDAPEVAPEETSQESEDLSKLRRFGVRACFAALLFSPLGLILTTMYLMQSRYHDPRPKAHWAVHFAWWVSLFGSFPWTWFLFSAVN